MQEKFKIIIKEYYGHGIFFISFTGFLGSLYLSEAVELIPCDLCWYQRILMYPLAVIAFVGVIKKDSDLYKYVLPFSLAGMVMGAYHYLLQKTSIFTELGTCSPDNPCSGIDFEVLGFVTIPLLSFMGFAAINVIIAAYLYAKKRH